MGGWFYYTHGATFWKGAGNTVQPQKACQIFQMHCLEQIDYLGRLTQTFAFSREAHLGKA